MSRLTHVKKSYPSVGFLVFPVVMDVFERLSLAMLGWLSSDKLLASDRVLRRRLGLHKCRHPSRIDRARAAEPRALACYLLHSSSRTI